MKHSGRRQLLTIGRPLALVPPRKSACATLVAALMSGAAAAAEPATDPLAVPPREPTSAPIPLSYVGSNARVGLGIDRDGDVQGEALGVWGDTGERAWLTQGWLGSGGAAGLQASYHWLWGGRTRQDTIDRPSDVSVAKFSLAWDQNSFHDRKGSIGVGLEREAFSLDVYYSQALSDERLLSSNLTSVTTTQSGVVNGHPFQQQITTNTLTEQLEHPYDHGIGFRLAHFFENPLLRLTGGLDYERGTTLLQGGSASQLTGTLGLEKHFYDSPHSLGLEVELFHKEGPFEDRADGKRDDARALLMWRYDFGRPFRPVRMINERHIEHTEQPPPAKPEIRRTQLQLSSQALFEFNRAEVTPAARTKLHELVDRLRNRRVGTVEIVGHTCDIGAEEYNQKLSERRANAVRDWLISEGVPANALTASGRGETEPAYPNDSEENRARNRRITLSFMSFDQTVVTADAKPRVTVETVREEIPTPATWIERALRTPSAHKRTVDTYHIERVTSTRIEGERVIANLGPQAVDDTVNVRHDTAITFAVLANDTDPERDTLTVSAVGTPANGTVVLNANATLTYTPNAEFLGTDHFTYTIRDPGGLTSTATVNVVVGNQSPAAVDDAVTTQHDVAVTFQALANDTDADGDSITFDSVGNPSHGTVVTNPDGTLTYTPATGFAGTDTIGYTIRDSAGSRASANITITVRNQAPVAADDTASTHVDPVRIPVLANDSDPDGDAFTLDSVSSPAARINADRTITYTPPAGTAGPASFTYTIRDSAGATATGTVTVNVNNQTPVANDDEVILTSGQSVFVDLLANDTEPDGDSLTISITRAPAHGRVTVSGRDVTYTPTDPQSIESDSFEYRITDLGGLSDTATVTILIPIIQ